MPRVPSARQLAQTPAEFVNRVMPSIRRAASALGLNPMALLAQAALETGWGQRMPRNADGSSSFNLFGIKAGDEWTGGARDRRHHGGQQRRRDAAAHGISRLRLDRGKRQGFRQHCSRVRRATGTRSRPAATPRRTIDGIGRSGYATDPEYANKLNQILDSDTLQAATVTPRRSIIETATRCRYCGSRGEFER